MRPLALFRGEARGPALTVREVLSGLGAGSGTGALDLGRAASALVQEPDSSQPWFTRVLIGAGTWVGALLIAIFCALTELFRAHEARVLFGVLFLAGAAFARRARHGDVATQVALVGVLAGQTLLMLALDHTRTSTIFAALMALQVVTILAVPDRLVRLLATLAAVGAAVGLAYELRVDAGVSLIELAVAAGLFAVVHHDARLVVAGHAAWCRPVAFGLATGLLVLALAVEPGAQRSDAATPIAATAGTALLLCLLVWLARVEARGSSAALPSGNTEADPTSFPLAIAVAFGAIALVAVLTAFKSGVIVALLLVALAHYRGERLLSGVGLLGLAIALATYYYELDTTLLYKSAIVLATGVVLLVARAAILAITLGEPATDADATATATVARVDPRPALALGLATALAIGGPTVLALGKERLLRSGTSIVRTPRPVHPRSLMQGDYMVLRYTLADEASALPDLGRDGALVVAVDATGVARLVRRDGGEALGPGEHRLRYRVRGSRGQWGGEDVRLGAESFLFEEGRGEELARARFAELRVAPSGESVLVGLRDEALAPLGGSR